MALAVLSNRSERRIASQSLVSLVLVGLSAIAGYIGSALLIRRVGAVEFGFYATVVAGARLASVLARRGTPQTVVRNVAGSRVEARHAVFLSARTMAPMAAAVGLGWVAVALLAGLVWNWPMWSVALVGLPAVAFITGRELLIAAVRGLGHVVEAASIGRTATPVLVLVGVLIAGPRLDSAVDAMVIFVLAVLGALLLALVAARRTFDSAPLGDSAAVRPDESAWAREGWQFFLADVVTSANPFAPLLLGAVLLADIELGAVAVALRACAPITLGPFALIGVFQPRFAKATASGSTARINRVFLGSLAVNLASSMPFLAILLFAPSWVLSLLGGEGSMSDNTLRLFALAHAVPVVVGPTIGLLLMSGHAASARRASLAGLIVTLAGAALVIARPSADSVALAMVAGALISNVLSLRSTGRHLGIPNIRPAAAPAQ